MSTLNVSNITDGTTTVGTSYVINGSAKAWLNMNGNSTIGLRDSFNTSSIADRGTALYTHNFTSSMDNSNYAGSGNAQNTDGDATGRNRMQVTNALNASSAYLHAFDTSGLADDVGYVTSMIHGDLA